MVQLTIAHPTSPTSSSLLSDLIYAFNGSLFYSKYIFLHHTHYSMFFSLDELPVDIYLSMSHTIFIPSSHLVPPPRFHFFQSHTTITYVTTHHTHTLYFFHIWYSNAVTTFQTNPCQRQYHLQIHSTTSPRKEQINISVRF